MRRTTPTLWIALAIVYTVWGSTYLAIRVAIRTMPPFLMASVRFLIAGGILYAFSMRRGEAARGCEAPLRGETRPRRPGAAQWKAAAIVGTLLFLGGNGGVVWAEQRVSSGVAALIVASVPLWTALIGFVALRQRLPRVAVAGLVVGFAGTALLIRPGGSVHVDLAGALALVGASASWATGTLYAGRATLPTRTLLSAGMQLLCGGVALGIAGVASGELSRLHPSQFSRSSIIALVYLVSFGSIVAFSAYAWLMQHAPPSIVSTYAYINPAIAVLLGWAILGEHVGPMTVVAGAIIVVAVAMIVTARNKGEPGEPAAGAPPLDDRMTRASEALPSPPAASARSRRRRATGTRPAVHRRGARR